MLFAEKGGICTCAGTFETSTSSSSPWQSPPPTTSLSEYDLVCCTGPKFVRLQPASQPASTFQQPRKQCSNTLRRHHAEFLCLELLLVKKWIKCPTWVVKTMPLSLADPSFLRSSVTTVDQSFHVWLVSLEVRCLGELCGFCVEFHVTAEALAFCCYGSY